MGMCGHYHPSVAGKCAISFVPVVPQEHRYFTPLSKLIKAGGPSESESKSDFFYSVLLCNNHLPICYRHRQSGSRLQARPAPTGRGPGLRLTAMPRPNLPFNGLHLHNPCKLHGSLLIYRPWRNERLSWPSICNSASPPLYLSPRV